MNKSKLIAALSLLSLSSLVFSQENQLHSIDQITNQEASTQAENDSGQRNFPWFSRAEQFGDNSSIYIANNYDYRLVEELMSGSGFGPGNGGNKYIFEVDSIIKEIISTVEANSELFPEFSLHVFKKEIKTIGVFFLNSLPSDESRVLAGANFTRERAILLSKKSWEGMSYKQKVELIFHEYLGVLTIEKENTFISGRISSLIGDKQNLRGFNPENIKWLYSRSNTKAEALKLDLNSNSNGSIVTKHGVANVDWSYENDTLILKVKSKLQYQSIAYLPSPTDGHIRGVERQNTLLEINLEQKDLGSFELRETWQVCTVPYSTEESPACSIEHEDVQQLVGSKELNTKPIRVAINDLITLPIYNNFTLSNPQLIQLLEDGKVKTLQSAHGEKIISWKLLNENILYKTNKGTEYKVELIKKQNGLDRVFVSRSGLNKSTVSLATMVIIPQGKLPRLSSKDITGDFLPIYAGPFHTSENQAPYSFLSNGSGGFETDYQDDEGTHSFFNFWSWSFDGSTINAKRYYTEQFDIISTEEEVMRCASKEDTCHILNDRDYIVLKVNGNRFTMLRLFKHYSPNQSYDSVELNSESSSIWVMDRL